MESLLDIHYLFLDSRIVKYWSHIVKSNNILIVQLYRSLVDGCNKGVNNWATNVRTLLDSYGFSYVWNNPNAVNLKNVSFTI